MRQLIQIGLLSFVFFTLLNIIFVDQSKFKPTAVSVSRDASSYGTNLVQSSDPLHKRFLSIPQRIGVKTNEHVFTNEVVIAVLDTGINLHNKWLMDRVYRINGKPQIYDLSGITNDGSDSHGHGSIIATIILSVNPSAKIIPIKYGGSFVPGLMVARLIPDVSIINISGGGGDYGEMEHKEIKEAQKAGILIVAASGNYGEDVKNKPFYPASLNNGQGMITVANLLEDGSLNQNSNYGESKIDVGIIGTDVPGYDHLGNIAYETGSSQATAIVSGLASLIMGKNPSLTSDQVKKLITRTATKKSKLKYGKVNASRAIASAYKISYKKRKFKKEEVSLVENNLLK